MIKLTSIFLIYWFSTVYALNFDKPAVLERAELCAKENNMEIAKVKEMYQGGKIPDTTDKNMNCFFKCMMVKGGFVTEKGEINLEKAKQIFKLNDGDEILKNMEKCVPDTKIEDSCERIRVLRKCMMKALKA